MESAPLPGAQERDPVGEAIRSAFRDRGLRYGVLAGTLTVAISWAGVLGLSYLPGAFAAHAFGLVQVGEHVSAGPRVAAALFAPWVTAEHIKTAEATADVRTVSLLGAAVLLVVLVAVGALMRVLLPTLRSRVIALIVSALGSASGLAIAAAFISYRIGVTPSETGTVTHSSLSVFGTTLVWTVAVGLFSYGVVARLHAPLRSALRSGGGVVAIISVTAAVAFPVLVVFWAPINQTGNVIWSQDLANGLWRWGGGVGAVAVPLAVGAEAHLPVAPEINDPFTATTDSPSSTSGDNLRLKALSQYMTDHPDARLTGYAGTAKTLGHSLVLLGAGLAVLLFVLASVGTTHALGAPRALDGFRHGLLVGVAAFLAVLALKWLGTSTIRASVAEQSVSLSWKLMVGPLFQTGGELVGICALSGLLYVALRPSPLRYTPWRPAVLVGVAPRWTGEQVVVPATADPSPTGERRQTGVDAVGPLDPSFCSSCGARLSAGAAFCSQCGAQIA